MVDTEWIRVQNPACEFFRRLFLGIVIDPKLEYTDFHRYRHAPRAVAARTVGLTLTGH
jgi:hypothetical protein